MPRKAIFTREEIVTAATAVIEDGGTLTARSLAARLASSARPVFTVFKNMDEVMRGVEESAQALYGKYVSEGLEKTPAFKGVGTAYIRFAQEHPKLFQMLFMKERRTVPDVESVLALIENDYEKILSSITSFYPLNDKQAKRLYLHMWIYTHGIAVLTVNKTCRFGAEEISEMLTEVCKSLIKNGVEND